MFFKSVALSAEKPLGKSVALMAQKKEAFITRKASNHKI
jgi:hypothetical protein